MGSAILGNSPVEKPPSADFFGPQKCYPSLKPFHASTPRVPSSSRSLAFLEVVEVEGSENALKHLSIIIAAEKARPRPQPPANGPAASRADVFKPRGNVVSPQTPLRPLRTSSFAATAAAVERRSKSARLVVAKNAIVQMRRNGKLTVLNAQVSC